MSRNTNNVMDQKKCIVYGKRQLRQSRTRTSILIHEYRCTRIDSRRCLSHEEERADLLVTLDARQTAFQVSASVRAHSRRCKCTQSVSGFGAGVSTRAAACGSSFSFLLRSFLSPLLRGREGNTVPSPIFYHRFARSARAPSRSPKSNRRDAP